MAEKRGRRQSNIIRSSNPPSATSAPTHPSDSVQRRLEYVRTLMAGEYIPDENVLGATCEWIRRSFGPCRIFAYGPCGDGYVDRHRHIDLIVAIESGSTERVQHDILLGTATMFIDANVAVITTRDLIDYGDVPGSYSHLALTEGCEVA